jgi:antitoxin component YwqK of YwqJK toxin-antitoxin module
MKYLFLAVLIGLITACGTEETEKPEKKAESAEQLVEVKDGFYTEWYPGKKQMKYRGEQDEANQRHGKWSFFSETGLELSFTFYNHGLRDGFTVVKYPTGALHYRGEYKNDQKVGVWTTYDEKGTQLSEKDYGYPKE